MPELDTTRAPRGVLEAQILVAAVAEQGDLAERHYLELKSTLKLSTKKDKEKIAKFILGAANRMPEVAATAFEGYGVMIIGVAQGAIIGIPPVEMMEISKVIQRYVGAAGPHWDVIWVPIEKSPNQVLIVIVDPPKPGQGPFPCRANGDLLTDGRVYIRADGETREANSEELDLLIQRGSTGAQVDVDFAVEVLGEIAFVTINKENTVEEYLTKMRTRLIDAMPRPKQRSTDAASLTGGLVGLSAYRAAIDSLTPVANPLMKPEQRSEEDYLESIDQWESSFRAAWKAALSKIVASQLRPTIIRITNRTKTFFHDVEVKLHLEGNIIAFNYTKPQRVRALCNFHLPKPPREWGPMQVSSGIRNDANLAHLNTLSAMQHIHPSTSYKNNGGSVDLTLDVGELRPRGTYESEDKEIVLIVGDRSLTSIRGTWELTARDHNDVYTGEIDVAVAGDRDLTPA